MPFSSKAQRRFMYAAEARGDVPKGTASRWEKHTKNKNLPEHVKKAEWITKTAAPATKPLPLTSIQKAAQKPMTMDTASFNVDMKQTNALSDSLVKERPVLMGDLAPSNLKNQLTSAGGQKSLWKAFTKTKQYEALPANRKATIDTMGMNLTSGRQTLSDIASKKSGLWAAKNLMTNKEKMAAPVNRGLSFINQSNPEMYKAYRDSTIARGGTGWKSDSLPPATDSIPQPKKRWWSSR